MKGVAVGVNGSACVADALASAPPALELHEAFALGGVPRLHAEFEGRHAVGALVLVVDMDRVEILDSAVLRVLASAANRLRAERSGSMVLRNASPALLQQLRLDRIDHMFDLEI